MSCAASGAGRDFRQASFHVMPRLQALLEEVGCSLLPLPPYSPDFNKIEPLWNKLKLKIALATLKSYESSLQ